MLAVEELNLVAAIIPVGLDAAANNGDWVSIKHYGRCTIVVYKAAGTAGDDPNITVQQATDATGANAKALNFTRVDYKRGLQTGIASFSIATQAAANTYQDLTSAEAQGLFMIDIYPSMMDGDNGFSYVQVSIPDIGTNAQVGCALYLLTNPRYRGSSLPNAIA